MALIYGVFVQDTEEVLRLKKNLRRLVAIYDLTKLAGHYRIIPPIASGAPECVVTPGLSMLST